MRARRGLAAVAVLVPIVAAVAVAVVAIADDDRPGAVELTTSGATYTTLDELLAASDLVVVATVADVADGRTVTAPDRADAGVRTRLVELDFTRPLAGEAPTPLVVEEAAALLDGTPVVVDGMAPLENGEQAIWFLVAGGSGDEPYHAVINGQGRYEVVGATLQTAADDRLSRRLAALGPDALVTEVLSRP